jgi:Helix-turn-helix domain
VTGGQQQAFNIENPKAIRALAHPRRLEILALLRDAKPLTVTEIARQIGDSTASVSYHLQQLALYGFIERATEADRGREKPWRARNISYSFDTSRRDDAAFNAATHSLRWAMTKQIQQIIDGYLTQAQSLPREWQEAAVISESGIYVTASELRNISIKMLEVLEPYRGRTGDEVGSDVHYSHIILYGIPSVTDLPPRAGNHDGPLRDPTLPAMDRENA